MLLCGMPARRKPHPRSLDALFPRPRTVPKAAVKLCPAKHRQMPNWRPGNPCARCEGIAAEALKALAGKVERAAWRTRLGPAPAAMEMLVVETGRVIRFAIPRRLMRRGQRKRRR